METLASHIFRFLTPIKYCWWVSPEVLWRFQRQHVIKVIPLTTKRQIFAMATKSEQLCSTCISVFLTVRLFGHILKRKYMALKTAE